MMKIWKAVVWIQWNIWLIWSGICFLWIQIFRLNYFNCRLAEEGGILTDCSIKTQEPEDIVDFNFSSADVVNKIIMKVREQFCFLFRHPNHRSICSTKKPSWTCSKLIKEFSTEAFLRPSQTSTMELFCENESR